MTLTDQKTTVPKTLLGLFMPATLTVITLVLLNFFRPALINGSQGTILSVLFWAAVALSLISLSGLVWHFLRQMAADGFTIRERLSLGGLILSILIITLMATVAAFNLGNLLPQNSSVVNQLFWGTVVLMLLSLVSFITSRFGSNRRRKKKSRMYYF